MTPAPPPDERPLAAARRRLKRQARGLPPLRPTTALRARRRAAQAAELEAYIATAMAAVAKQESG